MNNIGINTACTKQNSPSFGMALNIAPKTIEKLGKDFSPQELLKIDDLFVRINNASNGPIKEDIVFKETPTITKVLGKLLGKPQKEYRIMTETGDFVSVGKKQLKDPNGIETVFTRVQDKIEQFQQKELIKFKMQRSYK